MTNVRITARVFLWTTFFHSLTLWSRLQIFSSSSEWKSLIRQTADVWAKLVCLPCRSLLIAKKREFAGPLSFVCEMLSAMTGEHVPAGRAQAGVGTITGLVSVLCFLLIQFPSWDDSPRSLLGSLLCCAIRIQLKADATMKIDLLQKSGTLIHLANLYWAPTFC